METDEAVGRLKAEMRTRFGVAPEAVRVVRAPYRICPLGAHVDHQLGAVTAMAIDRAVYLAYAPSGSDEVRLQSLSFAGEVRFRLADVPPRRGGDWGNYARGAALALKGRGALPAGIVGVTEGRLGEGGLSSSAAVGVAYLLALEAVNGLAVPAVENVALDRAVENGYLGLRNGVLDPAAVLLSRRDHLTTVDCRTVSHELIPRAEGMPGFAVLVAFSGLRQALVTTGYNRRVEECADAARALLDAAARPGEAPLLGNVKVEDYERFGPRLSGAPARRAAHFFGEQERVRLGVQAWREGDLAGFGRLMTASGRSSIELYECGSPPLIDLYEILVGTGGVYGGRFSGAGFRGCCVGLVEAGAAEAAAARVREAYAERRPELAPDAPVFVCSSDDGARIL